MTIENDNQHLYWLKHGQSCLPVAQKTIMVKYLPNAETTQRGHHKGDHRYGIKQAAGYARIVPSPTTTASPPT